MWKPHYEQFAAYNRWANRRVYDEAARGLGQAAGAGDLGERAQRPQGRDGHEKTSRCCGAISLPCRRALSHNRW
jgi:hypothetical protein